MKYRSDIDGLRALAVLPVVLFHAGIPGFSGGYVGVDVFFVISGFLITKIIIEEIKKGTFTIAHFYERRIRRIFPALMSVLALVTIAGYFILIPSDFKDLGKGILATTFFVSNILFWREAGYFAGPAEELPLLHTWSLAVEEQFYIFFPLYLILLFKFFKGRVFGLTLLFFALSLGLSIWGVLYEPTATFYLLPTRAWELFIGSLLAFSVIPVAKKSWINEVLAASGALMIIASVILYTNETPFPGLAALLPCLGAGLIIYAGQEGHSSLTAKVLSLKPFVFIGLISYSLYLWHWPLIVYAKYVNFGQLSMAMGLGVVAVSILLSYISWRFVEQPFRGRGSIFSRAKIFTMGFASMAVFTVIGAAILLTHGAQWRANDTVIAYEAVKGEIAQLNTCENPLSKKESGIRKGMFCELGAKDAVPDYALIGDSHAMAVRYAVSDALAEQGRSGYFLANKGCSFIPNMRYPDQNSVQDACDTFTGDTLKFLQSQKDVKTVFIVSRWSRGIKGLTQFHGAMEVGQKNYLYTDPEYKIIRHEERVEYAGKELVTMVQDLVAAGKEVHILTPLPEIGYDTPKVLARGEFSGLEHNINQKWSDYQARHDWFFTLLPQLKQAGAIIHEAAPIYCDENECKAVQDDALNYSDDDHLSRAGAERLKGVIAQTLQH